MKKILLCFMCLVLLIPFSTSNVAEGASRNGLIDDYININYVKKEGKNLKINYTVKKTPQIITTYTIRSYWRLNDNKKSSVTATLKKTKGTYILRLKPKTELIGPQYVEVKASLGGKYNQVKRVRTFYKYPPAETRTHTISKKEAIAKHFMITGAAFAFNLASKRSPYGIVLKLASYGIAGTYTLKSLNVVGGYPSPAAGQYIRTKTSYNTKGMKITVKMWTNKQSYKKGVKPIYTYSHTHPW
ncbi:hypothetical protein [Bacillus sp. UNC125MFCrub1.1]|uniref:hypothetical protein n=1 Tax=Bacillus TaxID=1386 RepID=UPI000558CF49|nr:hypothetical protein [Bacillus sp. UNC125MFCrub1.1]